MSGGLAYIFDASKTLEKRYNPDMVGLQRLEGDEQKASLKALIERHVAETTSPHARDILDRWDSAAGEFWMVVPHPEKAPPPKVEKPRPVRADRPERSNRTSPDGGVTTADPEAKVEQKSLDEMTTRKPDASSSTRSAEQQTTAPSDEKEYTGTPVESN
jgi:glutamate synthase domain-containing protein 3